METSVIILTRSKYRRQISQRCCKRPTTLHVVTTRKEMKIFYSKINLSRADFGNGSSIIAPKKGVGVYR